MQTFDVSPLGLRGLTAGQFARVKRMLHAENQRYTTAFVRVDRRWPEGHTPTGEPVEAWRSRDFLAVIWREASGSVRLSVNRTTLDDDGRWRGDITWDELMAVKRGIGRADQWACEVYPPDDQVVNVANMRHLFLLPEPPAFAWLPKEEDIHAAL